MSITLPATFIDRISELSAGAVKTYLCLSWLKTTGTPYPAQRAIAKYMNVSHRSVISYLAELERAGYIEKRQLGSGRRLEYVLLSAPHYGAE